MIRKQDIIDTASQTAHTVADRGSTAWEETVEHIAPLLDQAATKLAPYADQAKQATTATAKKAAGFAADQVERLQPSLNSALDKVSPAVDKAQHAIQEDLVPRLLAFLQKAAATPAGQEAQEILDGLETRADASMAALKTELVKSEKSTSRKKTVITVAAVGAVLAALAVAVKTFLGSKDDWAAYEPDEPYVYPDDDPEIDVVIDMEEPEPATSPYGEGSYKGPTPPEGYVIKGNERSMKYHIPGSAGYARTSSDVWFVSEEAAEAAGFARSQR